MCYFSAAYCKEIYYYYYYGQSSATKEIMNIVVRSTYFVFCRRNRVDQPGLVRLLTEQLFFLFLWFISFFLSFNNSHVPFIYCNQYSVFLRQASYTLPYNSQLYAAYRCYRSSTFSCFSAVQNR